MSSTSTLDPISEPLAAGDLLRVTNVSRNTPPTDMSVNGADEKITVQAASNARVKIIAADYTIQGIDNGMLLVSTAATAITVTVPEDNTEEIDANFQCSLIQRGAGQITVAKEGTDVIESEGDKLKLSAQHTLSSVIKWVAGSPNTWGL